MASLRPQQTKLSEKPSSESVANSKKTRAKVRKGTFILSLILAACAFIYRPPKPTLPYAYAVCCRRGNCIVTVDDLDTRVECIGVYGNKIVDTGERKLLKKRWGQTAPKSQWAVRYIEPGTIMVPGLSDSHAHILEYGATRRLPLESGKTVESVVGLVSKYIVENEDILNDTSRCVESWGWDHTSWPVQEFPKAEQLDADPIIRGRPIVLQSKDGHAIWVSKSLLESNGPYPDVIDGGLIVRDAAGNPTGVFLDNAQDLIKRPALTQVDLKKRFKATLDDALAVGLTSIHDAGLKPASLEFFLRHASEITLPIRIYGMTYFNEKDEYWGNKTTPLVAAGLGGRLDARSVKIFADGALRSGGAALHAPYTDSPETNGFLVIDEGLLKSVIPRFLQDGWQVNVHAIGDRANAIVIDAFESALVGVNVTSLRPRLEHAQIMTKTDMARLGRLGVIASVQPTHATSDMWYAQNRLGPERVKNLYAFRTLLDNGARITFGSDFPVEDINPLAGFYAAVSRLSPQGTSPHGSNGWFPDQKLTRAEALRGMTIDPAYASFAEAKLGSLVPGKLADFVVLSQDILTVPQDEILATKVLSTVIDGRIAYGSL